LRELSLKIERLSELTTDELNRVNAAAQQTVLTCLSLLGGCQSVQQACTTAMSCGCQPTWNCA